MRRLSAQTYITLCFLLSILVLTACDQNTAFRGLWVNPKNPNEILELHKDGTFVSNNGRDQLAGVWNVYKKNHITLTIISDKDGNLLDARLDPKTDQLIITIAGDHVLMQRVKN